MVTSKKITDFSGKEKIVTGPKQLKNGRTYIEVHSTAKNSRKKRIYALQNLHGYKLVETVSGKDLFECIYFSAKCTKDFWKRTCGYVISPRKPKKNKVSVYFYEKK